MKARSLAALALFVVLATANSGGYRYGVGDQAFYQPVTELRLHAELFPRDRALIESQAKLTIVDEVLAATSRAAELDLPQLFFALYVLSLVLTFFASAELARVMGLSTTATALFLTILTLRHRIAKTGANTLEGYMHPRQLAFALGIFALTASLRRRWLTTLFLWVIAAAIHPTTAAWFAVFIAGEFIVTDATRRQIVILIVIGQACFWAAFGRAHLGATFAGLKVMDADWLRVLGDKDYIFASSWPVYAWLFNIAYLPLIWWLSRRRNDSRLLGGSIALAGLFALSLPFSESHIALAVQLQISRVFWVMDFVLALFGAWLLIDSGWARRNRPLQTLALTAVLVLSVGRGVYSLETTEPRRHLVDINLPAGDWTEAMSWLRTQPTDWLVLAHPDHAWLYGTSVRVAAARDVVVESVKDAAISMYDRDIAMRTEERLAALANFDTLDAAGARALGREYSATVVVTANSHPLDLPALHRNGSFTIYDLR